MAKINFMKYISWSERRSIQQSMMREGRGGEGGGVAIPVVKPFLYLLHIMI